MRLTLSDVFHIHSISITHTWKVCSLLVSLLLHSLLIRQLLQQIQDSCCIWTAAWLELVQLAMRRNTCHFRLIKCFNFLVVACYLVRIPLIRMREYNLLMLVICICCLEIWLLHWVRYLVELLGIGRSLILGSFLFTTSSTCWGAQGQHFKWRVRFKILLLINVCLMTRLLNLVHSIFGTSIPLLLFRS